MPDENEGFEPEDAIDMGYLSLPAEVQAGIEEAAGLHARIDAALQASMDHCARCKACDAQVTAVLGAVEPLMAERDAEIESLRRKVADYENAISWNTSCTSCAAVLDSSIRDHDRAERAEEKLAAIRRGVSPATVFYAEAAASDLAQELAERAESHRERAESAGPVSLDAGTGSVDSGAAQEASP